MLERLKRGASRGLFRTSIFYIGEKPSDADRLKAGLISLFQGGGSTYSTLRAYGLNFERSEHAIELGSLILKGRILHDNPAALDADVLNKHIFISGVTSSGKTTTCHKLLCEARRPFLVIEPAKTEYREFINHFDDVTVFTVGDESTAPLRLNPFELVGGENVSAHIDMLKATFISSFARDDRRHQGLQRSIAGRLSRLTGQPILEFDERLKGRAAQLSTFGGLRSTA